jgi:hypothetical protein
VIPKVMVVAVTVPSEDVEPATTTRSPFFSALRLEVVVPSFTTVDDVTVTVTVEPVGVDRVMVSPETAVTLPPVPPLPPDAADPGAPGGAALVPPDPDEPRGAAEPGAFDDEPDRWGGAPAAGRPAAVSVAVIADEFDEFGEADDVAAWVTP